MLVLLGNPWDVNLSGAVELTSGEDYTVTFTARGAEGRDLVVGIGDAGAPYHNHSETLSLTDGWQTYTLHLTAQTRPMVATSLVRAE